MSFPPNCYLIGAQKAGTRTLAYLLNQHPRITIGRTDEPHFFTDNWSKGLDWYRKQFPEAAGETCLDASTSYSMAPLSKGWTHRDPALYENTPAKVRAVSPEARFVYLLRDPVDRTYSGYWHDARMGVSTGEFRTALQRDPFYLDVSDYHGQLLRWLEHFPLSSFHFVLFDEMKARPHQVANDCFAFFGLPPVTEPIVLESPRNQSRQVGWVGRRLNQIEIAFPGLRALLGARLPKRLKDRVLSVKAGSAPLPRLSEEDRRFLVEYFRERNQDLEKLIGKSLDGWQR
jgi:sulfotransferase family protein